MRRGVSSFSCGSFPNSVVPPSNPRIWTRRRRKLGDLTATLEKQGFKVTQMLERGEPAQRILEVAKEAPGELDRHVDARAHRRRRD